ncbi:MAG: DUF4403 family protein [Pseudorhodoplanes sp.]
MRWFIAGALIVAVFFGGTLVVIDRLSPAGEKSDSLPALVEVPALPQLSRSSLVVTPVVVAFSAIRGAMENAAPQSLSGKKDNVLKEMLSNADIGWTLARGPLAVSGRDEALTVTAPVNGAFRATGQIANQAGNLGGALGGLVNADIGRGLQSITGKALDQRADMRGTLTLTARPALFTNWRLDPNLGGQVAIGNAALSIAGVKLNVGKEIKPLVDKSVAEQIAAMQSRLRSDPFLEQTARREWAKMCRSISIGAAGRGLPDLWLEIRPTRAFAAQPRIQPQGVLLTVGAQLETRVVPEQTKPVCPFPAHLEIVPPQDRGRLSIATPIDIPFVELNKLLDAQFSGRKFPDDGSGSIVVTVQGATLAASGDRLLISLRVKAAENRFLSLGAEGVVHVWGRPQLDREQQMLRLTDVTLAVESEAAFGLLGAAARAAAPQLQAALAERAVIDLKPLAASARKSIEAALAEFRKADDDVRVEAAIDDLRLTDISFDARALRVVAEAEGRAQVAVNALPAQ